MDDGTSSTDRASHDPESRSPVRAVAAAVGLTVAALVASALGGVALVVPLLLFEVETGTTLVFLALAAAGQVGFLLAGYAYARHADIRVRVAVPDGSDLAHALGGTVGGLAVAVVFSAVLAALDLVPGSVIEEAAAADPTLLLGLAALSVVLVAPAEEFLFRGVIQARLRRAFGPPGAVAGASLLFGSLHLANYTGTVAPVVAGALLVAAVGGVFGWLYERTANLAVPVLAHAAYNVVLLGLAFAGL